MNAILTGDIVNSRTFTPDIWTRILETELSMFGLSPTQWERFRGDSFQVSVPLEDALSAVIRIRAALKGVKNLDARIAIGIGENNQFSERLTSSTGDAFINSGEAFDQLKSRLMSIQTPWCETDGELNLYMDLMERIISRWTVKSASLIYQAISHPGLKQAELAQILKKSQSGISEGLYRAGFEEIMKVDSRYRHLITEKLNDSNA